MSRTGKGEHFDSIARRVVPFALAILFIAAAAGKVFAAPAFARVVGWTVVAVGLPGGRWAAWLASIIVAWEVALGVALLFRRRRIAAGAACVTLVVFTSGLVVMSLRADAPSCGCLGLLATQTRWEAELGIARNLALIWMCGWLVLHDRRMPVRSMPSGRTPGVVPTNAAAPAGSVRAFTLIEMLVVIAVTAIVLALALPALGRAREQGKFARSISMHRQLLAAVQMYSARHDDGLPYFATPGDPRGPKLIGGFDLPVSYFRGQSWHWASLLVDADLERAGLETSGQSEYLTGTLGWPEHIVRTPYFMTHTAFAAPAYWATDKAPTDLSLLRGTRQGEIAFPSQKGLLLNGVIAAWDPAHRPPLAGHDLNSVGWADGSESMHSFDASRTDLVVERPFGSDPWAVMATRHGLAGRDR